MQLVVFVVVLALGKGCFSCKLETVSTLMESCGQKVCIQTTICEGLCYSKDPVFGSPEEAPEHKICKGDWSYEVKNIEGCPESITYPVATKCNCSTCNTDDTYCGRFHDHMPTLIPSC